MRRPSSEEPVITPTHLTPDVLDQLREADAVVNEELANHDLMRKISQVPVVLIPLPMDEPVVRPLHMKHTHDALLAADAKICCERRVIGRS
jgi:hypothetical protein